MYLKLDEHMDLVITINDPIYRGDRLNNKMIFLLPLAVGDIDLQAATVYLSYIRADGTADISLLTRLEELHNETHYQYTLPITSTLTRYAGEICAWLQIYAGNPRNPMIAKSGECTLRILDSKNMDEYISDRNLSLIYEMQRYMEDKVEKAESELTERLEKTEQTVATKADNLIYDPESSTIQLVSTIPTYDEDGEITGSEQILLGEPIFVRTDDAKGIVDMTINGDGELVVTYDTEDTQNLGKVVGTDGAVYVPHVDEKKILTFTIETKPGKIPDPVDLDPSDEWGDMADGSIDGQGVVTPFTWESL